MKSLLKKNIKQNYTISFKQITDISLSEGTEIILHWRRGDKKGNKGDIKMVQVHDKSALYSPPEEIKINCTLFLSKGKYEEKGMELSIYTIGKKKNVDLCKGYIDLANYADLNNVGKDVTVNLRGSTPAKVHMTITSLVGEVGGDDDETEVLSLNKNEKNETLGDVHEMLIQQVDKKNHQVKKQKVSVSDDEDDDEPLKGIGEDDDDEEERLLEMQKRQREIEQKEELAREEQFAKKVEENNDEKEDKHDKKKSKKEKDNTDDEDDEKKKEKSLFAAAASGLKIKGKKEKDKKKKFTQEDVDKAVEKALKEYKEKNRQKMDELKQQIEQTKTECEKEKVC